VNQNFGLKHFLGTFGVCVAVYLAAFYGIEHLRNRKGPWQVAFTTETNSPAIIITQPALKLHNVKIVFAQAATTKVETSISFNEARAVPFAVPFGQCVFLDTTTLPGTVALQIFGYEIQLLPRVLTIDGKERTWQSDSTISLDTK
jgi:hypothetical protein